MTLDELIPDYLGEDLHSECKILLDRDNLLGWLKTVDGFANGAGGTLFVGVEDKTYKLIGFSLAGIDKEKLFFAKTIAAHFAYPPSYLVSTIPYNVREKTLYLLRIDIAESEKKPVILKYDGMPMVFIRRDGFTNAASSEELMNLAISGGVPHFDQAPTDIPFDESKFGDYLSFYTERNGGKKPSLKDFFHAGAIDEENRLKRGATLFLDDYEGQLTRVDLNVFSGLTRGDDRIVSSLSFRGNLIRCYRFIHEAICQRMNRGFIKQGDSRIDIDAYPERALFEAIINALAHRDYTLDGTQISFDLFPNRLVVTTPGSMYGFGRVQPTRDLTSFRSKRRNEVICGLFIMSKAMEGKSTGFEKIAQEYASADLAHKPYIYSDNNQSVIVLPDLTSDIGVTVTDKDLVLSKPLPSQNAEFVRILGFCYTGFRSAKEIADFLGVASSSYFRKNMLKPLLDASLLIEDKKGNSSVYKTNADFVSIR